MREVAGVGDLFGGQEGADGLAFHDLPDVSWNFEVKDEEGDVAFLAHGQGSHVHDTEAFFEGLLEGEGVVAGGGGVFVGVCGVDAIDFGGFEEDLAVEFSGPE